VNYTDVVNISLSYSDRATSLPISSSMDNFIKIVEARINRHLMTQKMSYIVTTPIIFPNIEFSLPPDFLSERSIRITQLENPSFAIVLQLCNPEQMANIANNNNNYPGYMIMADALHIWPTQKNTSTTTYLLEINYFRRLINLSAIDPTNWLSEIHPDCYVFGLLTEINSFAKDAEASALWNGRFTDALNEITALDNKSTYSGTPITTKVG
jgi:hypothetical protein